MTHTPGPWKTSSAEHGDEYAACVVVNAPKRRSHGVFIARAEYVGDTHETEANARLIAAAPSLLSALEELTDGTTRDWEARIKRARAVIAQAKGETK